MLLDDVLHDLAWIETTRRLATVLPRVSRFVPEQLCRQWPVSPACANAAVAFAAQAKPGAVTMIDALSQGAELLRWRAIAEGIAPDLLTPDRVEAWARTHLSPDDTHGLWREPWDYEQDMPRWSRAV